MAKLPLISVSLAIAGLLCAANLRPTPRQAAAQESLNLVGEIMDSRCAVNGSHEKVMKENNTRTARDCTLLCAKTNGSFVLFDPDTKTVYQLDDQQKPEQFAGQRVRISGTYDERSKTMHVQSIDLAE